MTGPYFDDGRAQLWQGDALALLAGMPSGAVGAVMADPPYSSGGAFRGDRAGSDTRTKYVRTDAAHDLAEFSGDNRDQRSYAYWTAMWLSEALRVTRPGGACMLWTDWRQLPTTTDALQAGGWVWRGVVPWAKNNARPQMGRFAATCEFVIWGTAGPTGDGIDVGCLPGFYLAGAPKEREHITQKPLDVMRSLVRICPPDGTVLDPFMGSGTTGVAALIEGRRFVGFELSEHYAEVARDRISKAAMAPRSDQLDLLGAG